MRITAGKHQFRQLRVPKSARPTFSKLKASLFNICQSYIVETVFLDLFAGAGGIGLEALSRGAKKVVLVESDKQAQSCIRQNIELLKEEKNAHLMAQDVFEALKLLAKRKERFDIIFADPPYGTAAESLSDQVAQLVDELQLLNPEGELFLEDALEASNCELPLKHLHLKSSRRMGKTMLRQYVHSP